MLSRRHRFHGQKALSETYRRGQTVRAGHLAIKYARRDPSANKPYRVAVVVSKKVHKSAVTRNRIRRRIYESVRRNGEILPGGLDMVVTVYHEQLATMPANEIDQLIGSVLAKITGNRGRLVL